MGDREGCHAGHSLTHTPLFPTWPLCCVSTHAVGLIRPHKSLGFIWYKDSRVTQLFIFPIFNELEDYYGMACPWEGGFCWPAPFAW